MDFDKLKTLRSHFEKIFASDTAHPMTDSETPSAGHCAVVAAFMQKQFPEAELVSTHVDYKGSLISHWFNYIDGWFVDLTGDQFELPSIRIWSDDKSNYKIRRYEDLTEESCHRLELFNSRFEALSG